MAGKGPIPKPDKQRARGNKGKAALKVVTADPVPQPPLPATRPGGEPWPEETVAWWERWGRDALAEDFRPTDWSELMDTAVVHAELWSGNLKVANELRLRTARFGATAEDRARLRIQYAAADRAEEKQRSSSSSRSRYRGLRAVDME